MTLAASLAAGPVIPVRSTRIATVNMQLLKPLLLFCRSDQCYRDVCKRVSPGRRNEASARLEEA